MKKGLLKIGATLFAATLLLSGCSKKAAWYTDLDEAKAYAKKTDKNIFLLFSGDDWVAESKTFKDTIANSEEFIKAASKDYVLVNIDFSQEEYAKTALADDATEEQQKEAERIYALYEKKTEVAQKYNLYQYPSMFLLTKDEIVIANVPFDTEVTTPAAYLETLATYNERAILIKDLVDSINKTKGVEKANNIEELYQTIANYEGSYVSPWLDEYIKEYPSLDPENETGNVARYQMDIAYAEAISCASIGDATGASQKFVDLCETSPYLTNEDKQTAYYTAAYLLAALQSDDYDRMLDLLTKAYDIDTESEIAEYLVNAIEGINQMKVMAENYSNMEALDDDSLVMTLGEGETSE